jgi:AhpD family alkylhydroperoxidase
MATLNRAAAEAMNEVGASACTDVTGFGLFGHLISLCRHSGVTAQIFADRLPAFDGALEALADGVVPGAIERNTEYVGDDLSAAEGVPEANVLLGYDAQTSGGLLIAVSADRHEALLADLSRRGVAATTIGEIVAESAGQILMTLSGRPAPAPAPAAEPCCAPAAKPCCAPAKPEPCCPAAPAGDDTESSAPDAMRSFGGLMRAVGQGGLLDERTKELITFTLTVITRCSPCVSAHLKKALRMGITRAELDEAAWCAVAMGGAPVRMFYLEALEALDAEPGGKSCC